MRLFTKQSTLFRQDGGVLLKLMVKRGSSVMQEELVSSMTARVREKRPMKQSKITEPLEYLKTDKKDE